jgi:hypothetical protein
MKGKIGVGIIGIELGRGWASTAHVPALRALPAGEEYLSRLRLLDRSPRYQRFHVRRSAWPPMSR